MINKIYTKPKIVMNYWYSLIDRFDKENKIIFMNYGLHHKSTNIFKEENKYHLQLYAYIMKGNKLKGKDILEIGCGRGGGIEYIRKKYKPKRMCGIDICKKSILFCNKKWNKKIKFKVGTASNLPYDDNSFDYVINIESSHRYDDFLKFLKEVYRTLRNNGRLLYADFRSIDQIPKLEKLLEKSQLKIIKREDITPFVLRGMDLDTPRRLKIINKHIPLFIQKDVKSFAGIKGTKVYNLFKKGKRKYLYYLMEKR